ncbi:hypothetical protein [Chitinimonas sp.]|uniref:hypothetical protein n=1 Tax=Chitinimonas sp. TaxID=1934313 RepID=UPI0035B00ABE
MQSIIDARQLRLKHHVFFKEVPDGVLFDAGRRSFILRNAASYPLIARIIQLMDAGRTLSDIHAALPTSCHGLFDNLIRTLQAHDMVQQAVDDTRLTVPAHAQQLWRYLQDNLSAADCAARFAGWQQETVLLVGAGYALKAAINALSDADTGHIALAWQTGIAAQPQREELDSVLNRHGRSEGRSYRWLDPEADWPARCGLVIYASDTWQPAMAERCAQFAAQMGAQCVLAAVRGQHGLVMAPTAGSLPALPSSLPDSEEQKAHSPASCALLGCLAVHHGLQLYFGLRHASLPGHVHAVSPWLEVSEHPLHQSRSAAAPVSPATVQLPKDRELSQYEQLRIATAPWFDPLLGRFDLTPSQQLRQVPLFHEAIAVRSAGQAASQLAVGWGCDAEEAGLRALAHAFALAAAADMPGKAFLAAFDYQSWYDNALAHALVARPEFAGQCHSVQFDPAKVHGEKVQLLARLLRLYQPAALRIRLHTVPGLPACLAECHAGEQLLASAIGTTPLQAMEQALGEACSRWQLRELAAAYGEVSAFAGKAANELATPQEWLAAPPSINPGLLASLTLHTQFWRAGSLPLNTYCGHISIVEGNLHG